MLATMKLALLMLVQATVIFCQTTQLEQVLQWKQIDFVFPCAADRTNAINQKLFIQKNVFPIDVAVDYCGK